MTSNNCRSIAVWLAGLVSVPSVHGGEFPPQALEFFEKEVRPLLAAKCFSCHGRGQKLEGKIRLTSRAGIMEGGDSGAGAVASKPDESLLIKKAIRHEGGLQAFPGGELTAAQIASLTHWVELGLPWPAEPVANASDSAAGSDHSRITAQQRGFWSFRPVQPATPPEVHNQAWIRSPLDAFILRRLEGHGLVPVPPADKRTLLRRVTFDLTGLPPTPREMAEFLADERPEAFARVVERLLASAHYGERWGRHWLDVARYADSSGKDENHACANAFRYRDYVVQAFNEDKPFDRFIREQIAGDLLPAASDAERFRNLTATGFLQLGPKALAEQDKPKLLMDIADEQIDVVSRAFLGLTISCARCHDHKLEPVPQRDYYALAGIFLSTRSMQDLEFVSKWLESPLTNHETQAMVVSEGEIADAAIHIRGNHLNPGEKVPRGFPQVIELADSPVIAGSASGRRELADWLARGDHPLTARVIVNRVWLWHFGEGLCRSPDNFGMSGQQPTHPELLDWLAGRFVADGWSLKRLHREILLSQTWQMGSRFDAASAALDPDNIWWWRFNRRRLEAEEIRDALLTVSGQLDPAVGGSLFNYANRESHVTYYKGPVNYDFKRRSLYLPVVRNALYDLFDLFDLGDSLTPMGRRNQTTIAPQALYFMNSDLVLSAAEHTAAHVLAAAQPEAVGRVEKLYEQVFARAPRADEASRALAFLQTLDQLLVSSQSDPGPRERLAWRALCQSLLASSEFITVE